MDLTSVLSPYSHTPTMIQFTGAAVDESTNLSPWLGGIT